MAKLHKNHVRRSPYEPDKAVDVPKKKPAAGTKVVKKKAAKKKAAS